MTIYGCAYNTMYVYTYIGKSYKWTKTKWGCSKTWRKAKQIDSLQQTLHQVQNENRSLQEKTKKVHAYISNAFTPQNNRIHKSCIANYMYVIAT